MPQKRRMIVSKHPYEICLRAREGLPFVARMIIRLIIGSVIARTQRDDKVELCHDIWNGSHCHIVLVTKDSKQCVDFYGEIEKKITDILKRLLGLTHMQIWEDRVTVAKLLDLNEVIERIAYLYANPAQDKLVESIEGFPGFSSWYDYKRAGNQIDNEQKERFPWIRLPSIPVLSSSNPKMHEELQVVRQLTADNKIKHDLVRRPNAWMKCFGIKSEAEVKEVNDEIFKRIKEKEQAAREGRGEAPLLGANKMRVQPIMKPHTPKKHGRKIFVLSSDKILRMRYIAEFKQFCDECRECYQAWRRGDFTVEWPLGAFKPPIPPNVNLLPA